MRAHSVLISLHMIAFFATSVARMVAPPVILLLALKSIESALGDSSTLAPAIIAICTEIRTECAARAAYIGLHRNLWWLRHLRHCKVKYYSKKMKNQFFIIFSFFLFFNNISK